MICVFWLDPDNNFVMEPTYDEAWREHMSHFGEYRLRRF